MMLYHEMNFSEHYDIAFRPLRFRLDLLKCYILLYMHIGMTIHILFTVIEVFIHIAHS